jgi:hypothetical protein
VIPIPYGTKFTVKARGSVWKPVTCEHCGCDFAYLVSVKASGEATNVLWLNKRAAIDSAHSHADQALRHALDTTEKAIPCPQCGRYQRRMVSLMRWQAANSNPRPYLLGFLALGITIALALLVNAAAPGLMPPGLAFLMASIVGLAVGYRAFTKIQRLDPNADAHTRQNRPYSEDYKVLRRRELERIVEQLRKEGRLDVALPTWDSTSQRRR